MLVDPDLDEIVNGKRGMLAGIDACIKTQCLVSAVGLLYSPIDAVSALTRTGDDTIREIFLKWVDDYLKPDASLKCSAQDLYGARCGIVHLYCPDSRLLRDGKAKWIVYRWKEGPPPDPELVPAGGVVLEIEDLRAAVGRAIQQFFIAVEFDAELKARVKKNCAQLLCYRPCENVQIFVAA